MKYLILLFLIVLFSCNGKKEAETVPDKVENEKLTTEVAAELLIVPGESIGNISINQKASELESILGQPDLSDAAKGKTWLTWFSKISDSITGNELNIYIPYAADDANFKEKVVRQIRITSPDFKTSNGISTESNLAAIKAAFPNSTEVGIYDYETQNPVVVYDDIASGIAFEIEDNKCTGVIIHERDKPVGKEYISFHPDMKPR